MQNKTHCEAPNSGISCFIKLLPHPFREGCPDWLANRDGVGSSRNPQNRNRAKPYNSPMSSRESLPQQGQRTAKRRRELILAVSLPLRCPCPVKRTAPI